MSKSLYSCLGSRIHLTLFQMYLRHHWPLSRGLLSLLPCLIFFFFNTSLGLSVNWYEKGSHLLSEQAEVKRGPIPAWTCHRERTTESRREWMDYLFQCPTVRANHTPSPFQKLIKHRLKVLKLLPSSAQSRTSLLQLSETFSFQNPCRIDGASFQHTAGTALVYLHFRIPEPYHTGFLKPGSNSYQKSHLAWSLTFRREEHINEASSLKPNRNMLLCLHILKLSCIHCSLSFPLLLAKTWSVFLQDWKSKHSSTPCPVNYGCQLLSFNSQEVSTLFEFIS